MKFISEISVKLVQKMGGDEMIVAAAKVSTSGEEALKFMDQEANYGLINYLIRQKHGSPFEHAALTAFVHAPIFVFREWMRHRIGFSYNEESGRYKQLDPVFWIPRRDRKIVPIEGYKAARPEFKEGSDEQYYDLVSSLKTAYTTSYETYSDLVKKGIAKEVARTCLPVGIYSSCWVTTNPRALMHFLSLRTHDKTAKFVSYPQAEIEEAARIAEQFLAEGWPLTYRSYCENGRVAP